MVLKFKRSAQMFLVKKGQSVLESVVMIPVLGVLLFLSFQFSFIITGRFHLNHQLYSSVLCVLRGEDVDHCQNKLIQNSSMFLKGGRITDFQLRGNKEAGFGFLIWEVQPWKIKLKRTILVPKDLLR